jgi:hypothetical protein
MKIHMTIEKDGDECYCGVILPKNTTCLRELVTCKECKKVMNKLKLHKNVEV